MLRKIYLILVLVMTSSLAMAQSGTLKGVISDAMSGEPIPFANIIIEKNGNQSGGTTTDFDGNYTIKPVEPGSYTIKATFVGYGTVEVTGVIISSNKITFQNVNLQEGIAIGEVKIIEYKKPLLDQDNLSGETKTAEEIVALPTRSVSSVAATTAGIYQRDEGDDVNVRGSRSDATEYYVDGIKVRGNLGVPTSGIEQITVIAGGIPAQYGDATGGIISVTTKGPSNKLFGGIEFETSSLFDSYNYNLLGFSLSGPILRKRNSDGTKGSSVLGYFIAGELRSVDDSDPSAVGMWKVKDDVLKELQSRPYQISSNESGGLLSTSEFLKEDDFENVQAKLNTNDRRFNISGKLDVKPGKNTFLSLGGSFYTDKARDFRTDNRERWRTMFSWDNNRQSTEQTYRFSAKLTQKFGSAEDNDEESPATIKNAFFTIQGDYTNNRKTWGDANHGDNLFRYGYVGKFETSKAKIYENGYVVDTTGGVIYGGRIMNGWKDTLFEYTPGSELNLGFSNTELENYTNAYYDLFSEYNFSSYVSGYGADGELRTSIDLRNQGLINGASPSSVYSLFANHGTMYQFFFKEQNAQTSFKASGSADIKSHEFSFGFEYEQREDAYWQVAPMGLWGLMRQLSNRHILERDLDNPIPVMVDKVYQDTINYNRLFIAEEQAEFDKNFRAAQALEQLHFIDIDSYTPDQFSLNMFSPDELLNNGSSSVYYYGYDAFGEKLSSSPTLASFFEEGSSREIAAYNPIYQAGYIQDKFAIEDLIFNIGLRIDRFDANQKVLKDKYLLYSAYTADANTSILNSTVIPSTIEDDYIVYVDDLSAPSTIVGYRDGDVWYNDAGLVISDPTLLAEAAGGKIAPYLIDPISASQARVTMDAFEDYKPQTVFMPRIAFSFPISDEAQFFAHYDVVTQRPSQGNRIEPVDYLFMADQVGALINNPGLQPEKTIDYELGFAKTLSLKSALKISAFYKELRDMVQRTNTIGAYPATYYSYGNIDFGTVKGLSASYDLRRTNNVQLTANYTLQFADGTGSSATSGQSLIGTGQPNLRTALPLSYDQRHAISASVDYHYGNGKDYDGPVLFGAKIFQDAGFNLMLSAGSGTPYSRQSNITQEAAEGINDRSVLQGSIFGSRLPWQFRVNLKANKEFEIRWSETKSTSVNVYIQAQNLLNAKNIVSVYRATGNADDDGYLTSASAQNSIDAQNDADAFRYLYSLKVNDPSNYSLPRMWRAGISIKL